MSYDLAFRNGSTFSRFLDETTANQDMWRALAARSYEVTAAAQRISSLSGRWRLLVLAEDWCGDAVNTLPVLSRLAEAAVNLDMRVVRREQYPEIMDRHLTRGSRSIPIMILLDESGFARGWWGPRPAALQEWFEREGRSLPKVDRYRELRRWYARDRGATIALEIANLVTCAAASDGTYAGTHPCVSTRAA
jgi:hypothetical protein